MTIQALIENCNFAVKNAGVESDSLVKIRLPDGKEYGLRTTEIKKHKSPFGGWHQLVIHAG
jgi:hypothetical protein